MPLYDYECENCSHKLIDVKQSFRDDPLSCCPECDEPTLKRALTGGLHGFVRGSNTVGGTADKNAIMNKNKISEEQHKNNEAKPTTAKPWYHQYGNATTKEINSMTNKQKAKYIMEGKN